ncbi:MAG: GNAT family N-acetyltransferase [Lachnospiraceae bacterium]|nr:GNAT family N-acetyltransferase [Lachnospiraceae bacterium]
MLKLRPYKRNDAEKVASWITSEKEFYEWSAGKLGDYPATADTLNAFSEKVAEDDSVYQMIAADDNEAVGYLILRYPEENQRHIRIGFVVLDPARRGRGYGIGMVSLALKYAFGILRAKRVTLGVFENNDIARKAYRTAGFIETGMNEKYEINGKIMNCIEMEARFEAGSKSVEENIVPEDKMIKDILTENKLFYAFQPIVDTSSGEIFGYEALMRADYGTNVSPMAILDYATRKHKLYDIEKLTLFNVMEIYVNKREAFAGKKIFINSIPGYQLKKQDYFDFKKKYEDYLNNVVMEITENTEFKDKELGSLLQRSADDGFELAIDDYGTGYSNTSSLLSYLPNYLKIDRLLISNIHEETKKQHFVRGIIEFAASNGVKTLAEGVETAAELKTVVEMGVDYVQGFYTARPSLDIVESIDEDIKNEIITSSVKGSNQEIRKIYTVEDEAELPVMRLALEKYTGILIGREEFTLVGNTGYSAEMSIKIKDGVKCRLTIRDVFVESTQQRPCIEIGTGSELTLVVEGENRMTKYGILVPESSRLTIEGDGNLQLRSQGISSFALGNFWDAKVGDIRWQGTGALDILVEADEGIGIGGGEFREGCGISLLSGMVRIEPASGKAIAIGAVKGVPPIIISDCKLQLDVKVEKGLGVGCLEGTQNTRFLNSNINILCAGNTISAIGTTEESDGNINIESSEVSILANGAMLYLIGAQGGKLNIGLLDSAINLRGEGNNVLALGTRDLNAAISAKQAICNIKIASGSPVVYGAKTENTVFSGGLQSVSVNE